MNNDLCAIFPAFGDKYLGNEKAIISDYGIKISSLVESASKTVEIDINQFNSNQDGIFQDELQAQYAVYIYSTAISDILKKEKINTSWSAGYSMGIYAALYHSESIDFKTGLLLIKNAYNIILNSFKAKDFSLGVITGLEKTDIKKIIAKYNEAEIINANNRLSFVIAGKKEIIEKALELAKEEGAMKTKTLPASVPYHSKLLKQASNNFREYLAGIEIKDPINKIVSTIDQKIISKKEEIKDELAKNIFKNISWLDTMNALVKSGVQKFIECGPGKSLYKTARFIDGNFKIYTINKLNLLNN